MKKKCCQSKYLTVNKLIIYIKIYECKILKILNASNRVMSYFAKHPMNSRFE